MRANNKAVPAILAGSVCLIVYLVTLSPACWVGDSGELAADAAILGIAHPPGYPLYTLVGRVVLLLSPLKPATTLNVLSALVGASSAAFLGLLLARLGGGWSSALTGGLLFGLARTPWSQSVVTEVYTLHVALLFLAFLLLLRAREHGSVRHAVAGCWVIGLGLAHHTSTVLLLPALAITLGAALKAGRTRRLAAAACVCAVVLAMTVYLYLPIRSRLDPPNDWGNPEGLRSLWDHLTGKLYVSQMAAFGGGSLARNASILGRSLLRQWSPPLLVVPLAGIVLGFRRRRRSLLLAVAAVPVVVFGLSYRIPDVEAQFVPLWAVAVVASLPLLTLADQKRWGRALLPVLAVVPLAYNYQAAGQGTCDFPERYARAVLETAPDGATILCQGQLTPVLAYLHQAEQVRPDVELIDRLGNMFRDPYRYRAATTSPATRRATVEERLLTERGFLYYVVQPGAPVDVTPCGLLFRAARRGAKPEPCALLPSLLISDPPEPCLTEPIVRELAGQYRLHLAQWAYAQGRAPEAREHLSACERVADASVQALSALADFYRETGETQKAASLYRKALTLDRRFLPAAVSLVRIQPAEAEYVLGPAAQGLEANPEALVEIARAWLDGGRPARAEAAARRLLEIDPHNCEGQLVLGNSQVEQGRLHDAEAAYHRAVSICPNLADAWANLCMIYGARDEMSKAVEAGQRAVAAEPANLTALNNLATTYARMGRLADAKGLWRRSLAVDPTQDRIRTYLASAPGD